MSRQLPLIPDAPSEPTADDERAMMVYQCDRTADMLIAKRDRRMIHAREVGGGAGVRIARHLNREALYYRRCARAIERYGTAEGVPVPERLP